MITLALLHKFVYEFRGNNTYIIQDRTALTMKHLTSEFSISPENCPLSIAPKIVLGKINTKLSSKLSQKSLRFSPMVEIERVLKHKQEMC